MSGPITNFEFGKMQDREYEAQASKYWGQKRSRAGKSTLTKSRKLVLALSGAGLTTLLIVQMLVL